MFFSEEYLSETEKIDRIYKMLRAERRGRIFKLIIKLALLGLVVYGYYYLSLPEHADVRKNITDTLQAKATEFILPMVGGMVQDLTQSMGIPSQAPASGKVKLPANITPEMIKAVQDAMKK
ncbi:MAG: hypothetical protein PHN60_01115 [Candidatus Gracilibacteria bacterium]|nr:hypothetical protein [Candidatus Gracilibacteria bacterium]